MTPYFAVLLATAVLMALSAAVRARGRLDPGRWTYFDLVTLVLLVVFSGSRVGVGTDYPAYVSRWQLVRPDYWGRTLRDTSQDLGFATLQLLLKTVTDEPQVLFWVTSVLTVVPAFVVIKRRSLDPTMAVWLYLTLGSYLLPFNVVRQGLAASILFYAATTYLDHHRRRYAFLAALATVLHASALPAAVILFLVRNWRPRVRTLVLVVGGGTLLAGFVVQLGIFAQVASLINPRYNSYVVLDQAGIGTYLTIAAKLGLLLVCYALASHLDRFDQRYLLFATIGIATLIVGTRALVLARLDLYFSLFLVLVVPNALRATRGPWARMGLAAASAVYMAVFLDHYAGLLGYTSTLF